jgi:hypothetical protein
VTSSHGGGPLQRSLSIAIIVPAGVPPLTDVGAQAVDEGRELARRGHAVAVIGPSDDRALVAEGRRRLDRLRGGDASSALVAGQLTTVALGRAIRTRGGRLAGPVETRRGMETLLGSGLFDVAHVYEPLAASPALGALRRFGGVRVGTFHELRRLAGAALLQPLIARSILRLDLRVVTSEETGIALAELVPCDYLVVPPGGHRPEREQRIADRPPRLLVMARGRDRAGRGFAKSLVRGIDRSLIDDITLVVPDEITARRAMRRTACRVVAGQDVALREELLAHADIVAFASPEDAHASAVAEAMSSGAAVLIPRERHAARQAVAEQDALAVPPFSRAAMLDALARLARDAELRARLGRAGVARAGRRRVAEVAARLEEAYRGAAQRRGTA